MRNAILMPVACTLGCWLIRVCIRNTLSHVILLDIYHIKVDTVVQLSMQKSCVLDTKLPKRADQLAALPATVVPSKAVFI